MNSTLDWLDFYENQKCIIWHQNVTKIISFVVFLKNTVSRVSSCFTLSATANTIHYLILRACKCINKSETRKPTPSAASGNSTIVNKGTCLGK